MWMDILDSPIVRFLETLSMEPYPQEKQAGAIKTGVSGRVVYSSPPDSSRLGTSLKERIC